MDDTPETPRPVQVPADTRALGVRLAPDARALCEALNDWQQAHPNIADYRVTQSLEAMQRVTRLLGYLESGQDPELAAALATFRNAFPSTDYED